MVGRGDKVSNNKAKISRTQYGVRIAMEKTPQDNPYYYSNERLEKCLQFMEKLQEGQYSSILPDGRVLTLKIIAVTHLTGGYRVDCEDACCVEILVKLPFPVSENELAKGLKTMANEYGVCISVLKESV